MQLVLPNVCGFEKRVHPQLGSTLKGCELSQTLNSVAHRLPLSPMGLLSRPPTSQTHFQPRLGILTTLTLKKIIIIFFFIFGCARSSLLCGLFLGFSLVEASGVYSSLQCTGFSLQWLLSCCGACALGHVGFSGCSTWAQQFAAPQLQSTGSTGTWVYLLQGTWHLPGSGIEPVRVSCTGR